MIVIPDRAHRKITLADDFAEITNVSIEGDISFSVTYDINQSEVIASGVSRVKITAYATRKKEVSIFVNKQGQKASTTEVIGNIQNLQRVYRGIALANERNVLSTVISDATSKVNNQLIGVFSNKKSGNSNDLVARVSSMKKTFIFLKEISIAEDDDSNHLPILQTNRNNLPNVDYRSTVKQSIKSMILKNSIDPSNVVNLRKDRTSAIANMRGIYVKPIRKTGYRWGDDDNFDSIKQTFTQMVPNTSINVATTRDIDSSQLVQIVETVPRDKISVPANFVITSDKLSTPRGSISTLFIRFEVLNSAGVIVDTIEKEIDVAFHLRMYLTPKVPPEVRFSRYDSFNKGTLQIFQQDLTSTSVEIYKKQISHISTELNEYISIGQFGVSKDLGHISIPVDISKKDTSIYRVISVGPNGVKGSEFTNVVINPTAGNKSRFRYISLTSKIIENGISIEVRELPPDATAFKILRKNKTTFETVSTVVGDDIIYIEQSKDNQIYSVVDNQAKIDNVYEYQIEMTYRDGTNELAGYVAVEYLPLVENLVDTHIVDLQTSNDPTNPDVSFGIQSKLPDGNLDTVKNLLERQGLSVYFADSILKERDKLKKLIAHQVTRVNLTTGQTENFGVITSNQFVDSELRKINSVLPLKIGYRYRYEVSTLLRAPETLFESLEKSAIDPTTKKPYSYKPSKFLHPITMKKGNILEREAQLSNYSKDDMSFGNVGDLITAEVSFAQDQISISDAIAFKYDKRHVLVQWTLNGSSRLIENFIVILEENGMHVPIGKVHATGDKRKYEYIHSLTSEDVGNYVYRIIPVFSDYSIGPEVKSNAVIAIKQ